MEAIPYLALVSALAGLGLAFYYFGLVKKESPGNDRMAELMLEIQAGAKAFLKQEYTYVAVFVVVMAVLVAVLVEPARVHHLRPRCRPLGHSPATSA